MKRFLILLLTFSFGFPACDIINPEEGIPTYIKVNEADLVKAPNGRLKSKTESIVDIWPIVNGRLPGVYELPIVFPVLESGEADLTFRAGVIENGIQNTRSPYPFYEFLRIDTLLEPTDTLVFDTLKFFYTAETRFSLNETFENLNNIQIRNSEGTNVRYDITNDPTTVLEGNRSLKAEFTSANQVFEVSMIFDSVRSYTRGNPIWVEFDYMTRGFNNEEEYLTSGFYVSNSSQTQKYPKVNFRPTGGVWKKIYVNYGTNIPNYQDGALFNFYLRLQKLIDNTAELYIDNWKVVYFE